MKDLINSYKSLSRKEKEELIYLLQEKEKRTAKKDFWSFCLYYDAKFFLKRPFLHACAGGMQRLSDGKIRALSISLPPRAGKSYLTSLFVAWELGNYPEDSIMRNTCTAKLYRKFSYDTREIIRSDKFKNIFEGCRIKEDMSNLEGWNLTTSKQVGYFGAGVGGTIIGYGATRIAITDDLYKSIDDALSETTNDNVHRWKESAHDSRQEKNCAILDIGTRWTTRDVIGKGIEEKRYDESIIIAALTPEGKSFCEDVKTTAEYIAIKNSIAEEIWSGEYMQEPAELEGLLFKPKELQFFKLKDIEGKKPESVLGYGDIADAGDDHLSMPFAKVFKKKIFITEVLFTKENTDITIPLAAGMINRIKPEYVRIESNSSGRIFSSFLRDLVGHEKILTINNSASKQSRIMNMYGFIKMYCVFLDKSEYLPGSDYDKFMKQLFAYMKDGSTKKDDAPDSLAGLTFFIQSWLPHLFS